MRDLLLLMDALQTRATGSRADGEDSTALVCALVLDRGLPLRQRWPDVEWTIRLSRLRGTDKRELQRRLVRGWRELGIEWRPSSSLPSLSEFAAIVERLMEACRLP
jgi:hypothetical protein